MRAVYLSSNDFEAARQIIAWLTYPNNANQRADAEQAMLGYLQRLIDQIPRYRNGRAIALDVTQSRMVRIDKLFFEAIYAGQVSNLSIIENGVEISPWPLDWGEVGWRLSRYDVGETDARKQVIKRYWRRYRSVLHLASAMDSHFASIYKTVNPNKPLEAFLIDSSWVDKVLSLAADIKKCGDPKMRRFDAGPGLIDFCRQTNF